MHRASRRRNRPLLFALILVVLAVGAMGLYLGNLAGELPWQEEPTRIPITPFSDIPGFAAPTATP